MPSATPSAATQPHIPAWKRLGLKLKSAPTASVAESAQEPEGTKRKREDATEAVLPAKKIKKSQNVALGAEPLTPQLLRKKSVTFTPETKIDDGDSIKQLFNTWTAEQKAQNPDFDFKSTNQALTVPEPPKVEEQVDTALNEKERRIKRVQKAPEVVNTAEVKSKKNKKAKTAKPAKIVKPIKPTTRPFLQYLKQYHDDKASWKFNKNHQNHLLKNLFDVNVVPSDHIHLVFHYIQGLQGGVRTRLRDTAIAIKVKDLEDGPAGFGDKMSDKDPEELVRRQKLYDDCCAEYVATMSKVDASTKAGYEEGLLAGLSDFGMQQRTAKRVRAEQILANLAAGTGGKYGDGTEDVVDKNAELAKRETLASKARRNRKARTSAKDDTSSSDDTSDSDSSSDSSSSEEASTALARPTSSKKLNDKNDTSSTSSSSSSDSEELNSKAAEDADGVTSESESDSDSD